MTLSRAIQSGDLTTLPSRRDEDWRWSDLRGAIRIMPAPSPTHRGPVRAGPFGDLELPETCIINGRGLGAITVAAGKTEVFALRFVAGKDAGTHLGRFAVDVGAGANLVLLESYEGQGSEYVVEANLTVRLADGARMERIVIAADDQDSVSVSRADIELGPRARLDQTVLTSGAKRQRIETRVVHPGADAVVRLDGVYILADKRHADITTVVTHAGAHGVTEQLTKGVVSDQSRGVFQGRIVVSPGADKTEARMGHHALVLSDHAEVDAKPELEIYADDVTCAHGNTVGALDEDALFYARQRGIPDHEARAMLTGAFVGEAIDRIGHDGARQIAHAWAERQLEARP